MFGCLCWRVGGPLPFRGSSPPPCLRRGALRFASAAARYSGERISPASVLGVSTPCALCFLWFRLCALAAGPCPPKAAFVSSSLRSALGVRFACIQFSSIVARRVSFPRFARGNAASFRFGSFLSARAARLPPEPPTKSAKGGGPRPTAESLQALREQPCVCKSVAAAVSYARRLSAPSLWVLCPCRSWSVGSRWCRLATTRRKGQLLA